MPEWLRDIVNSKNKTFLAFCFCFIAGAGIFSFLGSNKLLFYSYIVLFLILFFIIILWHKKPERFLLACLLVFVFGGMRFLSSIPSHDSSRIEYYNGSKAIIQGWVSAEPDIRISESRYTVSVLCKGNPCEKVNGKVVIKTLLYPQYNYGDKLEVSCSLEEPENFGEWIIGM